jgi:molybdate transport system ATP-binding protein
MTPQVPVTDARLLVDVDKRLLAFHLTAQLRIGSETLVLFGPSGAGKTTTLNIIAGLAVPDSGEILLDGRPLFRKLRSGPPANLPARKREIGYVFQHYALFPHLTAFENIAFALRSKPEARSRVMSLMENMGLSHLAGLFPRQLSGGQQQRVALARALAPCPRILLLDEPFSALDAALREMLQREIRKLQAELKLIVIYVTHRLEDAFAVGHRLAVLREGRVEQVGPLVEVFRRPANDNVAAVMGIRNLFRARVADCTLDHLVLDWDGLRLEAMPQPVAKDAVVTAYIQPEDVKVIYPDRPLTSAVTHNQVAGHVVDIRPQAGLRLMCVSISNGKEVEVHYPAGAYGSLGLHRGAPVRLSLRKEALVILHPARD